MLAFNQLKANIIILFCIKCQIIYYTYYNFAFYTILNVVFIFFYIILKTNILH